eukprot:CAMPEP_0206319956 /NCGR_PEP_ID=MMETSP0106_2-20121207/18054_1 /ASSEMBLY_ACC=CAM_ASM_000206 /TAXON_ID=81532 /ORGANISM="Acanthoeca-like sp., Strain 10tr" /LENGTH=60 /DNA_ID=CAMNT_0053751867 /DNA_START=81 /DNA_END=263 /DNA_ORIENTATION=+
MESRTSVLARPCPYGAHSIHVHAAPVALKKSHDHPSVGYDMRPKEVAFSQSRHDLSCIAR